MEGVAFALGKNNLGHRLIERGVEVLIFDGNNVLIGSKVRFVRSVTGRTGRNDNGQGQTVQIGAHPTGEGVAGLGRVDKGDILVKIGVGCRILLRADV